MVQKGLPLSRVTDVTVTLSARAAQGRNFGSMLIPAIQQLFRSRNVCASTPVLMISVTISGWIAKNTKPP